MLPDGQREIHLPGVIAGTREDTVLRRFAATLAVDVVGYSRLMEVDEVGTMRRFQALRFTVLDVLVQEHGGCVTGTAGDCLIATFDRVDVTVACAVRLQEALARWEPDMDEGRRMQLRVGINAGGVLYDNGAVHGDGINIAARIQALAEPGGVLVTDEAHRHLGTDQANRFSALGPQLLKNIARRVCVWHWHPNGRACSAATPAIGAGPTIAVLPFDNLSRDPRWDRLCDGLVEDMITDLARHSDISVIGRHSSFEYRGRMLDVREIGRALGVRYVLQGSVQANAGRVRTTAQLVDAASGVHVWADRYSGDEAELFVIQDEVVRHVVAAVAGFGGSIVRMELMRAHRKPPASLQTYELYLLGYEQEARLDREGTLRSIEFLEAAVLADPHFSRAWTVLGWAWGNAAQNGWVGDVAMARARKREVVQRAVALDPNDSLALEELGALRNDEGDFAGAREAFERALAIGPSHADTLALLAKYVAGMLGRPDEAMALMERAFTLNPHAPSWYYLGHVRVAYYARHFELALDAAARATPIRPQRLFRVLALAQLDRKAEMAVATQELYAADPDLQVIEAEAMGLCPAARDLFLEGVHKARLGSSLDPIDVRGNTPAMMEHEVLRA